MGILSVVEDRPTPKNVYNYRIYLSAGIAAFAAVMIGYDSAFIGGTVALDSFRDEFDFDDMTDEKVDLTTANIVSTFQAGCFFGALVGYPLGQLWGRKRGLLVASLTFLFGAGLMLGANSSRGLGILFAGRIIAGFGIGAASNLTPIYISEIAPPAIRGRLIGLYELGWQTGGLVGFWINYAIDQTMEPSHKQWIIPFGVQLVPAGVLALGSLWIKESPRWLLQKGHREQAIKNLSWIRQLPASDPYMVADIAAMDAMHEEEKRTVGVGFFAPFKAVFAQKKLIKRLLLGCSLFIWQNGSGINAVNYYSPTVFSSIGVSGTSSALLSTGIFGVIKMIVTFVWLLFLVDRLGRRSLLLIGGLGGGVCMYAIGAYIKIADPANHPTDHLTGGGIVAMLFFYLWTIFYTPSWNGTPWIFNAEVFEQNVRTFTQACTAANNWFWNFIIVRFTPQMFSSMGYGVYLFFATIMVLSIPYVYFLVPETKNIPLEDMDRLFEKGLKARNAHTHVMHELRLRSTDIGSAYEDSKSNEGEQIEYSSANAA